MPGGLPTGWQVCAGTDFGSLTASTSLTTLTASSTANSFTGITPTSLGTVAYDTSLLVVTMNTSTAGRTGLLDIMVGPSSGTAKVLFSQIPARSGTAVGVVARYHLPVDIPAGTQIWARIQSSTISDASHSIKIDGYSGAFTHQAGGGGGEGVGVTTATSLQTSVTGGGANAMGSPAALIASTARDYGGIVSIFSPASAVAYFYALGIGAAGVEQWIVNNQYVGPTEISCLWLPIIIPAGTRVAMKCQTVAGAQVGWGGLIGLYR